MRAVVRGVSVELSGTRIVHDADLIVEEGELVGLVGPNGSGKSTLLRAMYRAVPVVTGAILLGGDELASLSAREGARRTAVLAQETPAEFDFSVSDVVMLGRIPHLGLFDVESAADRRIVEESIDEVGAGHLRERVFMTLSGGEKQRALLAKALAQQTPMLVLDEPTNHLDIGAQLALLDLVKRQRITTIAALHELNLAAAYCDRVYVLHEGRVVAGGPPDRVLTTELLAEVFGVGVHRTTNPHTGRMHLAFAPLPNRETLP